MPTLLEIVVFMLANLALIGGVVIAFLMVQFLSIVADMISEKWRNS